MCLAALVDDGFTNNSEPLLADWLYTCPEDALFTKDTPSNETLDIETNPADSPRVQKMEPNEDGWLTGNIIYKGSPKTFYTYSAFFDDRIPKEPFVRIISLLPHKMPPLRCSFSKRAVNSEDNAFLTSKAFTSGSS